MSIQRPSVSFSNNDKRLIQLLARLLLDTEESATTNARRGFSPLSDSEAAELANRIDETLESKEFWQAAGLIEALSRGDRSDAREIYLSGRARNGYSRIMSSSHYNSFLARLGFEKSVYSPFSDEMNYEYFVRMESHLFSELGVSVEVIKLLERFLWAHKEEVDEARKGQKPIEEGRLINALRSARPPQDAQGRSVGSLWTANRIAGALTVFTDMTVMFTSRDWSVAGTMSAMAGGIGLLAAG